MKTPKALEERIKQYSERLKKYPKLCKLYQNCCLSTVNTALDICDDGSVFVLTGDIPAMWLRDSAAQVTHYIPLSSDPEMGGIIEGVIRRQLMYIEIDSYANAFNKEPNSNGHVTDLPRQGPWVFERKYEVDSLCYPIRLLYLYWKNSGNTSIILESLEKICNIIVNQWIVEQYHFEKSPYLFIRNDYTVPWDTIHNGGKGNPVSYTGMTWSGFRPSDDGCQYGYLTASEMFAVVVLGYMSEMLREVCKNTELADECDALKDEIDLGIKKYCIVEHEKYGKIYACETDGNGNYCMIDDANIPSLLSIPYIGYTKSNDEIYQNTRKFLLSRDNPFYFEGKYARGIGSRHTPENFVWHMALVMQGLTSTDTDEIKMLLEMIVNTDASTGYLHEGFDVDDPSKFTREWFTWPNSLFAEFVEKCVDENLI
jgi:meiotically up-regulated gene 157 (Mug157) protein